jgi:hypothetical protein
VVHPEAGQRRVDRGEDVLAAETPVVLPGAIGMNTFVATTISSRLRNFGSRRPVATSLAPFE